MQIIFGDILQIGKYKPLTVTKNMLTTLCGIYCGLSPSVEAPASMIIPSHS